MDKYTFSDFGLNPECNVYQGVKETTVNDGIEYAVTTIKKDSAVFVVDLNRNTVMITRGKDTDEVLKSKPQFTGHYLDTSYGVIKETHDYKIIGTWIHEMMYEYDLMYYGVIVENPDGSYQVLNQ